MTTDMIPILVQAAKDSGGETIDIALKYELPGITEEMYDWWGSHMGETRLYRMWHPDHISFEIEETEDPEVPFIAHPTEKIGKYGPSTMAFKAEPLSKYPFKPEYKHYRLSSHSDKGVLLSFLCTEYEDGPNGLKLRSIFRWPAKTPPDLVEALKQHCLEEVNNLPQFLPELYAKEGNQPDV